ncbi:MAG: hypothetical protein QOF84_6441 [Streptomyces sp.]|jgi:hypothetical protein|nr:hypothetical protein [Streptomyces sp.]
MTWDWLASNELVSWPHGNGRIRGIIATQVVSWRAW